MYTWFRWHIVSHSIPFRTKKKDVLQAIEYIACEQWINTINKESGTVTIAPLASHRATVCSVQLDFFSSVPSVCEDNGQARYLLECHKLYWCFRAKCYLKNFAFRRKKPRAYNTRSESNQGSTWIVWVFDSFFSYNANNRLAKNRFF